MPTIDVVIRDKIAQPVHGKIVCGNSDYKIRFDFDDEWAEYETKTARFNYNGKTTDVIFSGDTVNVPVLSNTILVEVGVFAGALHSTSPARIACIRSILGEEGVPEDPAPGVYDQIMSMLRRQAAPTDPAIVRDMVRCAMTYVNNKASLTYTDSGSGTLFDANLDTTAAKIDCSAFAMAFILGVPYEWSRYAGKDNERHYGYGMELPVNPYAEDRPNRYYSHELAHLFDDNGWCFKPNDDYSNIAPGDIIFVSFKSFEGSEYHENAYLKIDHCLLVIGRKDDKHLICLHSSAANTLGVYDVPVLKSDYDSASENGYNDGIKLVARLPFRHTAPIVGTPIITDSTARTTPSSSDGRLATLTLPKTLKKNTPYTLVASIENAFPQKKPSTNNYVGIRAAYASGGSDETVFSWQANEYPHDNLYRCYFVTGEKEISTLKLYILNTTVAGHKYNYCGLFEGLVAPTPSTDGTFD